MIPTPYTSLQQTDDFGLTSSNTKFSATLPMTTNKPMTVPGTAPRFKAVIKSEAGESVWVAVNETAALPGGANFTVTGSELIPTEYSLCREVKAGDVLNFITSGTDIDVSVVFYSINRV